MEANIEMILEPLNIDPFTDIQLDTPDMYFNYQESVNEANQMIIEASAGANKQNIFQKLWSYIVKGWKWLCDKFKKIWEWIKGLFTRKKTKKTADQVAAECGLQPVNNAGSQPVDVIKVERSEKSTMEVDNQIHAMVKDIAIKFDTDGQSVSISINDCKKTNFDKLAVKSNNRVAASNKDNKNGIKLATIMILISKPDLMKKLIELTKMTFDKNFGPEYVKKCNEFGEITKGMSIDTDFKVTLQQLQEFQDSLNEINANLASIGDISNTPTTDPDVINCLNNLARYCSRLQMGMNALTGALTQSYSIDAKYAESVNDITILDKFVNGMISAAIPPKYIAYNVYIVSSKKLKGTGSPDHPIWGQSRLVLFPTGENIVYKIAISGWGISANKSEISICNEFVKIHEDHNIARVINACETRSVITAEKVDTNRKVTDADSTDLASRIHSVVTSHNLPMTISDLGNPENIGFKNGKAVALDYGWGVRTSSAA